MPSQERNIRLVESFLTSNRNVSANNKHVYYNEHTGEVLLRYYDTLIAVRKGGSVRIKRGIGRYSISTNVLVRTIERVAIEHGLAVSHVEEFESGGTMLAGGKAKDKNQKATDLLVKNISRSFVNTDMGSGYKFRLYAPFSTSGYGKDVLDEHTYLDFFEPEEGLSNEDLDYEYKEWRKDLAHRSMLQFREKVVPQYLHYFQEESQRDIDYSNGGGVGEVKIEIKPKYYDEKDNSKNVRLKYDVNYLITFDNKDFIELTGTLKPYHTGRDYDYEFEVDYFADEKEENYYEENSEKIEQEILDKFYSTNFANGGGVGDDDLSKAVGRFYYATYDFENAYDRGGVQKLQKILGEDLLYKKAGKWFFNNPKIINMSISELNELTDKIKSKTPKTFVTEMSKGGGVGTWKENKQKGGIMDFLNQEVSFNQLLTK